MSEKTDERGGKGVISLENARLRRGGVLHRSGAAIEQASSLPEQREALVREYRAAFLPLVREYFSQLEDAIRFGKDQDKLRLIPAVMQLEDLSARQMLMQSEGWCFVLKGKKVNESKKGESLASYRADIKIQFKDQTLGPYFLQPDDIIERFPQAVKDAILQRWSKGKDFLVPFSALDIVATLDL